MGQYYNVYLEKENGEFTPVTNTSGQKLMEHSYFLNDFVQSVMKVLEHGPQKVAWVGDYADDYADDVNCRTEYFNPDMEDAENTIRDVYEKVYEYNDDDGYLYKHIKLSEALISTDELEEEIKDMSKEEQDGYVKKFCCKCPYFIVNYTKKQYINLGEYAELYYEETKGTDAADWFTHPLPLLTAIGNGLGGGDFWGREEEFVGYWALDFIGVYKNYEPDKDYSDVTDEFIFVESNE